MLVRNVAITLFLCEIACVCMCVSVICPYNLRYFHKNKDNSYKSLTISIKSISVQFSVRNLNSHLKMMEDMEISKSNISFISDSSDCDSSHNFPILLKSIEKGQTDDDDEIIRKLEVIFDDEIEFESVCSNTPKSKTKGTYENMCKNKIYYYSLQSHFTSQCYTYHLFR